MRAGLRSEVVVDYGSDIRREGRVRMFENGGIEVSEDRWGRDLRGV